MSILYYEKRNAEKAAKESCMELYFYIWNAKLKRLVEKNYGEKIKMKAISYTQNGYLERVSIRDFIYLIKVEEVELDAFGRAEYTRMFNAASVSCFDYTNSYLTREKVFLEDTSFDNHLKQIQRAVLTVQKQAPENVIMALEDCIVQCLVNNGDPKYFIPMGDRIWLIANPNDFKILANKNKSHIVCNFSDLRNLFFKFQK